MTLTILIAEARQAEADGHAWTAVYALECAKEAITLKPSQKDEILYASLDRISALEVQSKVMREAMDLIVKIAKEAKINDLGLRSASYRALQRIEKYSRTALNQTQGEK